MKMIHWVLCTDLGINEIDKAEFLAWLPEPGGLAYTAQDTERYDVGTGMNMAMGPNDLSPEV